MLWLSIGLCLTRDLAIAYGWRSGVGRTKAQRCSGRRRACLPERRRCAPCSGPTKLRSWRRGPYASGELDRSVPLLALRASVTT